MVATTDPKRTHNPAGEPADVAPTPTPTPAAAAATIAHLFPEVYRRYHFARQPASGELPVTRRALSVLAHLASAGPLTIGEQAEHLGLRRNSTSELIGRLEAKGLVSRIRDERDERRVLVWLTDAGRDVVSRIGHILAPDLLERVMAGLSPADRAAAVRGFELLARAEPSEEPPPPSTERNPR
jgi:DNA-binding MarR family transcriptional regulator